MSLYNLLQGQDEEEGGAVKGIATAVVVDNKDTEGMGRVKVRYSWGDKEDDSYWARVVSLMAGKERGCYFLPEVDDEVLVAFERGDIHHPYVIGALWNGQDVPPETNDDGENNIRLVKSRSGHKIILDDTNGSEKIEIIDKQEKNLITIDSSSNTITVSTDKDIIFKAPNGKISMECMELDVKTTANAKIEAGANMDVKGTGNTTIKGAMVMIN